jgi:hypothetical protein
MPIPERSAGREKTSNVTQVGGSEVLDLNTPIREVAWRREFDAVR